MTTRVVNGWGIRSGLSTSEQEPWAGQYEAVAEAHCGTCGTPDVAGWTSCRPIEEAAIAEMKAIARRKPPKAGFLPFKDEETRRRHELEAAGEPAF